MGDIAAKTKSGISVALLTLGLMSCVVDNSADRKYTPQVESAAFYGANNAWLVTWKGDLLWTNDHGINWETVQGTAVGRFENLSFIDERNGWASTMDGQVLRTTDGGRRWVSIAALGDRRYGPGLGQIKFVDENHGWIVHMLFFWRTEDGGLSWREYPSPHAPPKDVFYCFFISPQVGWLSGSGGAFYRTQDGGQTWEEETVVSKDKDLGEVSFLDHLVGWVAARPRDGIYNTQDGGKTWSFLQDPGKLVYFHSVQFITKSEGWATAADSPTGEPSRQKPLVLHTTDGGTSWDKVKVAEDEPLIDRVHFTDISHGWLLSRDNVYRTEDGGRNWQVVLSLPPVATK